MYMCWVKDIVELWHNLQYVLNEWADKVLLYVCILNLVQS